MKEVNFEEWLTWATSTNDLGIANVEPVISKFLIHVKEEGKPMFIGTTWNGSTWVNVSNAYRNMLTFVLLQNPLKYNYPALVGRSISEYGYHGVKVNLLVKALSMVPLVHWEQFFERYLPNHKDDTISSASQSGEEKLRWVKRALVRIVQLETESAETANSFNAYLL